jgi:zinc transport system substrate-binding protein
VPDFKESLMNKISHPFFLLLVLLFLSCSGKIRQESVIVVTIEPQRFFAEQLVDTLFRVVSMVRPGSNPETYDPSPAQMAQLSHGRAYFGIGPVGFEEAWLGRLKENNPHLPFFDNSRGVEWIAPDKTSSGHLHGRDPHSWASPKQARIIIQNMYEALLEIDPDHAARYRENRDRLLEKINETDRTVQSVLERSSQKSFFIYHPALTYFARDYGLTQYPIETDGKEPTPGQIKKLVDLAGKENIKTIFIQQEFDRKNAELLARETGCRLVIINPLSYRWIEETITIAKALADE